MARTKGAKGFKISDLFDTSQSLLRRTKGPRPRWNNILFDTGLTLDRLGRQLFRVSGKTSKEFSTWELAQLVQALRNCADVIETRAKTQDEYDEAIKFLKE